MLGGLCSGVKFSSARPNSTVMTSLPSAAVGRGRLSRRPADGSGGPPSGLRMDGTHGLRGSSLAINDSMMARSSALAAIRQYRGGRRELLRGLTPATAGWLASGRSAPAGSPLLSVDCGVDHVRVPLAEEEDARVAGGVESGVGVVVQLGVLDRQRAGLVVADEEDRPAALGGVVVADEGARDSHRVPVAVGVDGTAAAAARRARLGWVGTAADGPVVGQHAVEHRPGDPDAAQCAAVGAHTAAERAARDVDGPVVVLAERPDGRAAEVGAGGVAAVAQERRVDDLELAAAVEDGAATAAVEVLPGGVAVFEGQVLHGQLRLGLI